MKARLLGLQRQNLARGERKTDRVIIARREEAMPGGKKGLACASVQTEKENLHRETREEDINNWGGGEFCKDTLTI